MLFSAAVSRRPSSAKMDGAFALFTITTNTADTLTTIAQQDLSLTTKCYAKVTTTNYYTLKLNLKACQYFIPMILMLLLVSI